VVLKQEINRFSNHIKNILHGFFVSVAVTIAEPSTILPLIVHYFSGSSILVGIFASLLRGGAILVQLVAAFYIQSHKIVLPYLRRVFIARFLSWFFIGVFIVLFGETNPSLTLLLIGVGLFFFSFAAGFGAIFFNEISAKMFTKEYLGFTMSYRQFFAGLGSILSGAAAGVILNHFEPPLSFGYLFIISSMLMGIGLLSFATVKEPVKDEVAKKEKSFKKFIKNAFLLLKEDHSLKIQVFGKLLSNSYLIALPFIILEAKEKISISGTEIGWLISSQMIGAMLSNLLWGRLSSKGKNKTIALSALLFLLIVVSLSHFAQNIYQYAVLFFLVGSAVDGLRLSFGNLILIIAPAQKRPTYIALQANISSLGLFFSILGGFVIKFFGYEVLYTVTALFMIYAIYLASLLKE